MTDLRLLDPTFRHAAAAYRARTNLQDSAQSTSSNSPQQFAALALHSPNGLGEPSQPRAKIGKPLANFVFLVHCQYPFPSFSA
jgi:hypothetical protein